MNMNESAIITAPVRLRSDPAHKKSKQNGPTSERYIHTVVKVHLRDEVRVEYA